MKTLEITKTLTLSTAHITKETATFLDSDPDNLIVYKKGEYGWFINIDSEIFEEELTSIPYDLVTLIILAKENECSYLCLDCDGLIVEELPVYEW